MSQSGLELCGSFEFDHQFLLYYKQLVDTVTFADLVSQMFGEKKKTTQYDIAPPAQERQPDGYIIDHYPEGVCGLLPMTEHMAAAKVCSRLHRLKEEVISVYPLM